MIDDVIFKLYLCYLYIEIMNEKYRYVRNKINFTHCHQSQFCMRCKNITFIYNIPQHLTYKIIKTCIRSLTGKLRESHVKDFRIIRNITIFSD